MVEKLNIIKGGDKRESGEPASRRGFNMERVEEKIYVWNGYSNSIHGLGVIQYKDSDTHTIHVYDIVKQSWCSIQTSGVGIRACSGSGVCSVDHNIYVFGGFSDLRFSDTHSVFDTQSLSWKILQDSGNKPSARDKLAMFPHGKLIYSFGGWSFAIRNIQPGAEFHKDADGWGAGWNNEFHKYNTETNTWSYVATSGPLPKPRAASSFLMIDKYRALMFGGRTELKRESDLYTLDLSTNVWSSVITPLSPSVPWPSDRSLFTTHLVSSPTSDNPLVFGFWGMDNNSEVIDDYWLLDCKSMRWTSIGHNVTNRPTPRLWCKSCSFFNIKKMTAEIFVFGGCTGPLLGPESNRSVDVPGIVHMELGMKRLETLCIEVIVKRFELFEQIASGIPPKILQLINSFA